MPLHDRNTMQDTLLSAPFRVLHSSTKRLKANTGTPTMKGERTIPTTAEHHQTASMPDQRTLKREAVSHTIPSRPNSIGTPTAAIKQLPHQRADADLGRPRSQNSRWMAKHTQAALSRI